MTWLTISDSEWLEPRFNERSHAAGAALAGMGAIMGRASLLEADLRKGRLAMPFKLSLKTTSKDRVACARGVKTGPHVAAFFDRIDEEALRLRALARDRELLEPENPSAGG